MENSKASTVNHPAASGGVFNPERLKLAFSLDFAEDKEIDEILSLCNKCGKLLRRLNQSLRQKLEPST